MDLLLAILVEKGRREFVFKQEDFPEKTEEETLRYVEAMV